MTRNNVGHLVIQLEENFMKPTQIRDMPCKGYIYVIDPISSIVNVTDSAPPTTLEQSNITTNFSIFQIDEQFD